MTYHLLKINPYTLKEIIIIIGYAILQSIILYIVSSVNSHQWWLVLNAVFITLFITQNFILSPVKSDKEIILSGISKYLK